MIINLRLLYLAQDTRVFRELKVGTNRNLVLNRLRESKWVLLEILILGDEDAIHRLRIIQRAFMEGADPWTGEGWSLSPFTSRVVDYIAKSTEASPSWVSHERIMQSFSCTRFIRWRNLSAREKAVRLSLWQGLPGPNLSTDQRILRISNDPFSHLLRPWESMWQGPWDKMLFSLLMEWLPTELPVRMGLQQDCPLSSFYLSSSWIIWPGQVMLFQATRFKMDWFRPCYLLMMLHTSTVVELKRYDLWISQVKNQAMKTIPTYE